MKQEEDNNLLPSYFQQHELEVAAILLDVPRLIEQSSPLCWSSKRKRSSRSRGDGGIDSLPVPALSQQAALNSSVVVRDYNPKKTKKAVSPTTPLSLSLSAEESGDKPAAPRSKRRSLAKRSVEDWEEKVEESEEQGRVLRNEIDNVKGYYNNLVEENSRLKAIQLQLSLREEQRRLRLVAETQLAESRKESAFMAVNEKQLFAPAMCSSGCSCSGYDNTNNNSNSGAIDLNSESKRVDVCFPVGERGWNESIFGDFLRRRYDDWGLRMATAAQARKRRRHMMKEKEQRRLGVNSIGVILSVEKLY